MDKKPIKPIITIVVILFIILSVFVVFTTYLENLEVIDENQEADKNFSSLGNISSFNDAVNAFSFDIFEKFLNDPKNKDNVFISPYSIFTALAMTYEGAKGKTAEEMKEVLNIEQDNESFHEYMQSLYNYLNYNEEYNISTANALWIKENYPISDEYKDLILTYYGGNSIDIDYSIPDQAAGIINGWVENKTSNLIQNLISPVDIDPFLTVLILTNAIYFKGIWQVQFDEENTTERSFEVSDGEYIDVETMSLTEKQKHFNYTENEIMQILELPYSGNEISMNIFLPKEGYNLSDIINSMNREDHKELIESMVETELDIYLPKFTIKTPLYTLNDYLINLGMSTAFNQNADFSGITEFENINIDKVLHKAYVEVNEIGTEAAAATAVTMFATSIDDQGSSRIVFDADHPFLFTIHHKVTSTILFMGNIIDLSSE